MQFLVEFSRFPSLILHWPCLLSTHWLKVVIFLTLEARFSICWTLDFAGFMFIATIHTVLVNIFGVAWELCELVFVFAPFPFTACTSAGAIGVSISFILSLDNFDALHMSRQLFRVKLVSLYSLSRKCKSLMPHTMRSRTIDSSISH